MSSSCPEEELKGHDGAPNAQHLNDAYKWPDTHASTAAQGLAMHPNLWLRLARWDTARVPLRDLAHSEGKGSSWAAHPGGQ
eukprot:1156372-Pelagomonas_calceolata.AAC.6